jgi:hypothetical protein
MVLFGWELWGEVDSLKVHCVLRRRPVLNPDGTLSLRYEHGSLFMDEAGNACNRSAELQLFCSERELGPRIVDTTACSHRIQWRTPAACPQVDTPPPPLNSPSLPSMICTRY